MKFQKNISGSTILLIDNSGLSHYTSYLARGLSDYRNIVLYGFSKEDFLATDIGNENKIEYYSLDERMPKGNSIPAIIAQSLFLFFIMFRELNKRKYDIVHIQGHLPMFFLLVPILKLKGKRIFWTVHDVYLRASNRGIRGKLEVIYTELISMPRLLGKYADTIIVHGSFLKNQLSAKGIADRKIHVIPHFDYRYLLADQKKENTEFTERNLSTDYILFFGRIAPYKGVEVLIKASRLVKKQLGNNKFILLIAGEGDITSLKNLMSEVDYNYINILNKRIPNLEIPGLLNNANFLILPYTGSSQSGVIPLAYTFSKPVIVSNLAALSEYVEHGKTGLIFESGNSEQLANCIIELIKNRKLCIEMGQKANEKLLKEMSLELCCKTLNDLYDRN
jgi:alpha-maltose-1-phosphate synthase